MRSSKRGTPEEIIILPLVTCLARERLQIDTDRLPIITSPIGTKFAHEKLETLGYHMVKARSLYLTWA